MALGIGIANSIPFIYNIGGAALVSNRVTEDSNPRVTEDGINRVIE